MVGILVATIIVFE